MESSEAMKLLDIIRSTYFETFELFLPISKRNELVEACITAKYVFDWDFKFQEFYKTISNFCYPPLEFLWDLHILQVMPLEEYIFNIHYENDIFQKFKESVIKICIEDFEESDVQYFIQNGILSFLIRKAFPAVDDIKSEERIKEICLDFVKTLLQDIFLIDENRIKNKRLGCFFSLWNSGILDETSLQNFCSFALDYYLNLLSIENDFDAFELFETSDSIQAPYHLLIVIEKLVKAQKFDKMSQIFTPATRNIQTNGKCLVVTTKAFLKSHKEASTFVHKLLLELMNEAYLNLNCHLLIRSFLIRWQTSLQPNVPLQVCYKHWLQSIFRDCGRLKVADYFIFLIQVLSQLVPFYKSIECLKVAIELNVSVPSEAQSCYNDYVVLLKTRVQDLKPQSKPEETVNKILSVFECLGKIPPVIMEASLLQKHKYLNEFLPALLVPRVVSKVPDVKERFIDALDKAGKIPSNLLQKYRNACQQEQQSLIEGINLIDEKFDDFQDNDVILID